MYNNLFSGVRINQSLVFCVVFLSFFIWPLRCLSFLALRLLQTLINIVVSKCWEIWIYLAMLLLNWLFFQSNRKRILFAINYRISTINRLWLYIKMFNRVKYVTIQHDYCLKFCKWTNIFANSFVRKKKPV
jgi:hypothetical protein